MVIFNEEKHKYVDDETGKELISATTLLGKYKHAFDSIGNATRVAAREGVTVDFILRNGIPRKIELAIMVPIFIK